MRKPTNAIDNSGGDGRARDDLESRSPNERSVYFDAVDGGGVQCNNIDPSSVTSSGGGPHRRTTPAGQDRSLGSFRESQNVESVEKKEVKLVEFATGSAIATCCSSGGDSCNSRSCSDHSNKKQTRSSNRHHSNRHGQSRKHNSGSSSRPEKAVGAASGSAAGNGGGGATGSSSGQHGAGARRISLDDLSSAFQALISNSSAAVAAAATMSKKSKSTAGGSGGGGGGGNGSRQNSKSLMNRSFVGSSMASSDCCQSDNSGLGAGDNSASSAAAAAAAEAAQATERMRSRSEENLLDSNRYMGRSSHSHHMQQSQEERGVSYSPASLKQSNSMRSNDSSLGSSGGGGRYNLVSSRVSVWWYDVKSKCRFKIQNL